MRRPTFRTAALLSFVAASGAAALAACNAITGLDGDYRLTKQEEDASNDAAGTEPDAGDDAAIATDAGGDTGEVDAFVEDASKDDGSVELDSGNDAGPPTDAGFCGGSNVVFCTDFESASSDGGGTSAFGLEGARVLIVPAGIGSVSVVDGSGTANSRGLVVKLPNTGTGTRSAYLSIDLGPASTFDHLDVSFDMQVLQEGQSVPDFSTLGAIADRSDLKPDYGVGLSAGVPSTFIHVYDNQTDSQSASPDEIAQRIYTVHIKADRAGAVLGGTLVELTSMGATVALSKAGTTRSLATAAELSLVLGIYNASKQPSLEVHFDNVKVTKN